jgi:DNA-binding GntR family transcriptional regulator
MRRLTSRIRSKKDLVLAEIRRAIVNGELAPGIRLVIDDLAEKLGVSIIPVREALQQLHAEGYIVFEPFIGARVSAIEADSIVEVFSLLEAMEVSSSRLACARLTATDLAEVESIVTRMDKLTGDAEAWSQENRHFHEFICARAGTQLTYNLITKVLDHWDRLHRYFLKDVFVEHLPIAQKQHWQILRAIRTGDPDLVEDAVRKHNQSALRAYEEHLKRKQSEPNGNVPGRNNVTIGGSGGE